MANDESQLDLLEHSEAKVALYGEYLSIYLNILVKPGFNICIFDLLCGEGIYRNGGEGSPLVAIRKIHDHYYSHNQTCSNIEIWFNDSEKSKIDPSMLKVERVAKAISQKFVPPSVQVRYFSEDYFAIHQKALNHVKRLSFTKNLFFIDPYGYRGITLSHIADTLAGGNSEVLLFLPATFMYRFANGAIKTSFQGSGALRKFLYELFENDSSLQFSSTHDFITKTKSQFRTIFKDEGIFVDTFTIERDSSNLYCLFFFTSNIRGFEAMVKAKWRMDEAEGRGFRYSKTRPLLDATDMTSYPENLREYIESNSGCTNKDLRTFGLYEGYLAKHTNEILKSWLSSTPQLQISALDNKPLRKSSTYVSNENRKIAYSF